MANPSSVRLLNSRGVQKRLATSAVFSLFDGSIPLVYGGVKMCAVSRYFDLFSAEVSPPTTNVFFRKVLLILRNPLKIFELLLEKVSMFFITTPKLVPHLNPFLHLRD